MKIRAVLPRRVDLGELAGYRLAIAAHYDRHYEEPADGSRAKETARYLERVLDALDLPDEGAHLDVGCGDGRAALAVARRRPGLRVVGIDAAPNALRAARRLAETEGLVHARFVEADAEAPPAGPHHRLSALSVFNLLPDKEAALAAWRRVAAPGARLVLTDAFRSAGPGGNGTGAMGDAAFAALLRRTGWRPLRREDLTPLVRRLHDQKAWPWPEYVRPGFRYALHALEASGSDAHAARNRSPAASSE